MKFPIGSKWKTLGKWDATVNAADADGNVICSHGTHGDHVHDAKTGRRVDSLGWSTYFDLFERVDVQNAPLSVTGMTFRQYAAVAALQGILTHPEGPAGDWLRCSIDALAAADALIKQLEVGSE